jgi:dihydrofolate reductase
MTRLSVFIASSIDGYIATRDGGLEWLDSAARPGEDYGYEAFMASVDALAMGRGTYDFIAGIEPLPFGGRPLFVFTHRPPPLRKGVTFWERSPAEALAEWEAMGLSRVYVDGGRLISAFLAEGLIDDLLLTKVPVLLGDGIPLFTSVPRCAAMRLDDVQSWPSGMVNLSYSRVG